jgi:hypothetical protein
LIFSLMSASNADSDSPCGSSNWRLAGGQTAAFGLTRGRNPAERPILLCCQKLQRRSVLLNANASGILYTPAVGSALLAHAGSGLADTVYHYPARATAHPGLRNHAVGLISRRKRHDWPDDRWEQLQRL